MKSNERQDAPLPVVRSTQQPSADSGGPAGEVLRVAQVPRRDSLAAINEWVQGELAEPRLPKVTGKELGEPASPRGRSSSGIEESKTLLERTASSQGTAAAPPRARTRRVASTEDVVTVRLEESAKKMLKEAAEGVNAVSKLQSESDAVQSGLQQRLLRAGMQSGSEQSLTHVVFTDTGRVRVSRRLMLLCLIALMALGGLAATGWGRGLSKSPAEDRAARSPRIAAPHTASGPPAGTPLMQLELAPGETANPSSEPVEPATERAN